VPRYSDLPDPYAIVVMLPGTPPGTPPTTTALNGRLARMIAWLLDHHNQIEGIRGSVVFNFGEHGFQAEMRETFPYQNVAASSSEVPASYSPATDTRIRASDEFAEGEEPEAEPPSMPAA
jgi:hypothetical protein